MRLVATFEIISMAFLMAAPLHADPPLDGEYHSTAGDMLEGRGSESWPTGADFTIGDALNWASWDGVDLGTQWTISCPTICEEPELIFDNVNNGTGVQMWQSAYCGGTFWLDATDQPWGENADEYNADIQGLDQITTILFVGGNPISWVTNMNMVAHFLNYSETCITLLISNTERVGDTVSQTFPPFYPGPVSGDTCDDEDMGSAWDVEDITMTITGCATPVEDASWGKVKSSYR